MAGQIPSAPGAVAAKLLSHNIKFKWISGACNKAADCLTIGRCQGHPSNPYSFNYYASYIYPRWFCHLHPQQICNTADTIPTDPMPTSTNDDVNVPPTLSED